MHLNEFVFAKICVLCNKLAFALPNAGICFTTKVALESLLLIFKICLLQERDSSIVIPGNLHEVANC